MTVSICYIAQGHYFSARHSFESIGFAIKEKEVEFVVKDAPIEYVKTVGDVVVELFVVDITGDSRTSEYFSPIATEVIVADKLTAEIYNSVFRKMNSDYVCIIPTGLFLQQNWLTELFYYYVNVGRSGIASIPSNLDSLEMLPLPTNEMEEQVNVFVEKSYLISGISFFLRQHLYLIGAFDESISLNGNELNHFALRCVGLGFFNYYIPSTTCINLGEGKYLTLSDYEKGRESMLTSISEMRKRRNYYIPL